MSNNEQPRHRAKILVSDDDSNVRLLTRQCLEAEGMIVVEAADGPETLEVFVRERPDLVFLDVEMPGMTGLEVCERIRQLPQGESIPIMIVTGSDDRRSIDAGFQAGATQYKTKPVNWSLLGRDVQYMLRASNAFNALKRQEDRLRYLAYYDPLTSLPNRRSFNEQLTRILKRSQRRNSNAALLFIDLDHFKRINDSIGHGRGDRLLVEIAKRLTMELREDDAINYFSDEDAEEDDDSPAAGSTEIARLGGDEFTVVLSDVEDMMHVERVAKRILNTLSEPIALQSHNPVVTPSIGIAIFPHDGKDPDTLVRNADTAMYVAKAEGRACYRFYDEEMNSRAVEQLKTHAARLGVTLFERGYEKDPAPVAAALALFSMVGAIRTSDHGEHRGRAAAWRGLVGLASLLMLGMLGEVFVELGIGLAFSAVANAPADRKVEYLTNGLAVAASARPFAWALGLIPALTAWGTVIPVAKDIGPPQRLGIALASVQALVIVAGLTWSTVAYTLP